MTTATTPKVEQRRAEDRRHTILALRSLNPTYSLQKIGNIAGCTRERVRQVLKEEGWPAKCRQAATIITVVCDACGAPFQRIAWQEKSRWARGFRHHFCNRQCSEKWLSQHRTPTLQNPHANASKGLTLLLKSFLQSVFPLQCECGKEFFFQDYIGPEDIRRFIAEIGQKDKQ